jgi:hypothetical protein
VHRHCAAKGKPPFGRFPSDRTNSLLTDRPRTGFFSFPRSSARHALRERAKDPSPLSSVHRVPPASGLSPPDAHTSRYLPAANIARPLGRLSRWTSIHHRYAVCGTLPDCGLILVRQDEPPSYQPGTTDLPRLLMVFALTLASVSRCYPTASPRMAGFRPASFAPGYCRAISPGRR